MTCDPQLYIESDIDQAFTIDEDEEFNTTDINTISIKLSSRRDRSESIEYTAITKTSDYEFVLRINKTDITLPGTYNIAITFDDSSGRKRTVTPCPNFISFAKKD